MDPLGLYKPLRQMQTQVHLLHCGTSACVVVFWASYEHHRSVIQALKNAAPGKDYTVLNVE